MPQTRGRLLMLCLSRYHNNAQWLEMAVKYYDVAGPG
jgi:hypothetical protein